MAAQIRRDLYADVHQPEAESEAEGLTKTLLLLPPAPPKRIRISG
jgi:hypothetical protein